MLKLNEYLCLGVFIIVKIKATLEGELAWLLHYNILKVLIKTYKFRNYKRLQHSPHSHRSCLCYLLHL